MRNRFAFTDEDEQGYWYDRNPLLGRVVTVKALDIASREQAGLV
jgi:hypothetical protein